MNEHKEFKHLDDDDDDDDYDDTNEVKLMHYKIIMHPSLMMQHYTLPRLSLAQ